MTVIERFGELCEFSLGLFNKKPEGTALVSNSIELETHKTNIYFQENVQAGPFVKFDGVTWDESPIWRASVLLVTKEWGVPPFMTYFGRKIGPTEVYSFGSTSLWKYPLVAPLEESSRYIEYSFGGKGFRCYVANKEDPWRVQYAPNGVVEEEEGGTESDDEEWFGSIFVERTALHVIEIASSHFMKVFDILEVKEWLEQEDNDIQSSLLMNESTKKKVQSFFLEAYCQVFSDAVGKATPYLALSGGEGICKLEWSNMPFAEELMAIDTLFKNIFFHHNSSSTFPDEVSQPFILQNLNHYHWLSLDMDIARSKEKWMRNRTWRALVNELTECCALGAKKFVINVNIPLVGEFQETEADTVNLLSYFNPLEYFPKESCQYEAQLEAFFTALQGIDEKYSVDFLFISNCSKAKKAYLLRLLKKGEQVEEKEGSASPLSQKLTLLNTISTSDDERLEVDLGLTGDLEVTNKKEENVCPAEDTLPDIEALKLKEPRGFILKFWPFNK